MPTTDPPSRIPVGPVNGIPHTGPRARRGPWIPVFLLALFGLTVGLAIVVPSGERQTFLDVGSSVVGGSVVGLIFAIAQYAIDRRNQEYDRAADLRLVLTSTNDLTGIDLKRTSLAGAFLRGKNLTAAQLSAADLAGVDLRETVLTRSDLRTAGLVGARLDKAVLDDSELSESDLRTATARGVRMSGARLLAARLDDADLTGAQLERADLSRCSMTGTSLEGAHLSGARMVGVNGRAARLARVDAQDTTFALSDFTGAHLSRARLTGADLAGTRLSAATLIRADLSRVRAGGCQLAGADLTGSDLREAYLVAADLRGAVLTGCDLRGADLSGAALAGARGLDSATRDAQTRLPSGRSQHGAADHEERRRDARPAEPAFGARTVGVEADAAAGVHAGRLLEELCQQQQLSQRPNPELVVSLPLGARAPRTLSVRSARLLDGLLPGTIRLRIAENRADDGGRVLVATLQRARRSILLPAVPLDRRPESMAGVPTPTAIEQLAAHVLDVLDPRDGAPWWVRALVVRAVRRWEATGTPALAECRRDLRAAAQGDPWSPVVNYALGALGYNQYEADSTREAVVSLATAYSAAERVGESLDGLIVLILSGLALANCQLYHRFGDETPEVLAMSRTSAGMAVDAAIARRQRVRRRRDSSSLQHRAAVQGVALATYAKAFAQHITWTVEDAAAAIPIYEQAITALRDARLDVFAALYNNQGFQHMVVAGRFERGPDRERYRRAESLFKAAWRVNPNLYFAQANLGNLHRLHGRWGQAERCYREALTITDRLAIAYPPGHNELAQVLVEAGKDTEAAEAHERAIDITDSPSLRARFRAEYGRSLELVGRITDAGASAQRGLREDPGNVHCLALLDDVRRREAEA